VEGTMADHCYDFSMALDWRPLPKAERHAMASHMTYRSSAGPLLAPSGRRPRRHLRMVLDEGAGFSLERLSDEPPAGDVYPASISM
jgi:hypothetical protein